MKNDSFAFGCAILFALAGLVSVAEAGETKFTGNGSWHDRARWSNDVPNDSTKAIVQGTATVNENAVGAPIVLRNNANVNVNGAAFSSPTDIYYGNGAGDVVTFTATDANVSAQNHYFNNNAGGRTVYAQHGGTFRSESVTEFYAKSVTTAAFENVTATFDGSRLVVGRGSAPSLLSFTDCVFTNSAEVLMGVWGDSRGMLEFHGGSAYLGNLWNVGYGNDESEEPTEVRFENTTVDQACQVNVGVAQRLSSSDPFRRSYGRIVAVDSVWTNSSVSSKTVIGGGANTGSFGQLILSNCVFTSGSSIVLGQDAGTTGRVDVVGGTFNCAPISLGAAVDACGTLALHGSGSTITALPSYGRQQFAHAAIELVGLAYNSSSQVSVGKNVGGGSDTLRLVGGSLSVPSDQNIIVGYSNARSDGNSDLAVIEADGAAISGYLLAVGRNTGSNGLVVFRNGSSFTSTGGSLSIGYEGTATGVFTNLGSTVSCSYIHLPNGSGSTAIYVDGNGAETTLSADFRAGHAAGTYAAEIGGKITANRFFVGMKAGSSGTVTVVDGGYVDTPQLYVGWRGLEMDAAFVLKGGTVYAPRIQAYNSSGSVSGKVYFDGGTFKARTADVTDFLSGGVAKFAVGDGGAKFDSNGFNISASAALSHDDRTGAAAVDGGIVKVGTGTLTLSGALTFTGGLRVEEGTLDLSSATYTLGANAGISGSGTLRPPSGALTVQGASVIQADDIGLAVDGTVTFGPGATVTVANPDKNRVYTLVRSATSVSGRPEPTGMQDAWHVVVSGTSVKLKYGIGLTVFVR